MKLYSVVLVLRQNRVLPNESFSGDRNHGMIDLYMIRRFANMLFLINALTALLIIILSIFLSSALRISPSGCLFYFSFPATHL